MERLTLDEVIKYIKEVVQKNRKNKEKNTIVIPNSFISSIDCAEKYEQVAKWLEELKSYKDLEEQGLLVRLPCKVNDKLYHFYETDLEDFFADVTPDEIITEVIAAEFIIDRHEITIKCLTGWNTRYEYLPAVEIGKTVFLTREEAEKKLEEMKK